MSASNPAETASTLRLHDGRVLGYVEVGKRDGFPIFYFHGHHSSRLEVLLGTEMAIALGVRMIALDRPGIGRSDPKAGYHLLDRSGPAHHERRAPAHARHVVDG